MTQHLSFVHHSNTREVLAALDAVLALDEEKKTCGMLLLAGYTKTGKNAIIKHWLQQLKKDQTGLVSPHQGRVLQVDELWEPLRQTSAKDTYVTPITCILFSEIAFEMGQISLSLGPSFADRTWYRQPKSLVTDVQFASLLAFVRTEVKRLRVKLLIIDNAHWLDHCALQRLMLLRRHCENKLGIVLVTRLQTNARLDEPLEAEFKRVPAAKEICRRVEIRQLTKDSFQEEVLDHLMQELNYELVPELVPFEDKVDDLLWSLTRSDWSLIREKLARPLDKELGPRSGAARLLTRAMLTKVIGKPLAF